jgi:2-aminoadipate transaminase
MNIDWKSMYCKNLRDYSGYSIGKIFKYLEEPDIISLAGGLPSPDTFLIEETRSVSEKRLNENIEKIMQYTAVRGEKSLIEAVIQFLKRDHIEVNENQVLITSSGQHGLDITGRLFLNPGDTLLVDRPSFGGALVAFQMQRPDIIGVDIQEDGSDVAQFRMRIQDLKDKKKMPKFIYVVPDFQNPSGITMSRQKREDLLDISYEFGIPIVEDSPYRDLRYRGETIPSIFFLDQKRDGDHVIGIYTFSKIFCPGIRVGFNIGAQEIIGKMSNIKGANVLNTPKYNQDLCTAFLAEMDLESHLKKCRHYYREKLSLFLDAMEKYLPKEKNVSWTKPEGGLFLWVTLPDHLNTMALFKEAIKYKVAFVPGEVFYAERPSKNHMRINFSFVDKGQIIEAVQRLSNCIKSQL